MLSVVLRELDLSWATTRTGLMITTTKEARGEVEFVSYEVGDLCDDEEDYKQLSDVIYQTMWTYNPVAWDVCGGPGSVRAGVRGTLDVRNTRRIHHKIERLLAALRAAKSAG